jgi:hypothetical protein
MHALSRHNFIIRASLTRPQLCSASRISIATTRLIGSYPKKLTFYNSYVRKQVANMSSESTQSQACCNTPAVVSKGYEPKGNYIEVDGLKTCKFTLSHFPPSLILCPRCHRPIRRKARHPRRLRHLRLLQPDASGRRHSRLHGHQQVPSLHARLLRGQASRHLVVPAADGRTQAEAGRVLQNHGCAAQNAAAHTEDCGGAWEVQGY